MTDLATTTLTARDAEPERWALFLHGILGSGSNWRSLARRFCSAHPAWGAVLVDLRMHGDSQSLAGPHSIAAAAADLDRLEAPGPVRGVLGHSFGGKVALAYARDHGEDLEHLWLVDSMPGPRIDRRGSETTVAVLSMLRGLLGPFDSRDAFVDRVVEAGYERPMGQWLAMNLERKDDDQHVLKLDLDAIGELLDDYFAVDLWPVVEEPPGDMRLHAIVGGDSKVYGADDLARVRAAAERHPRVDLHVVEGAGHWVHVDAPDALAALLTP